MPWRPWGPGPAAGMTLSWESFIQSQGWPGPRSDHAQARERLPPTDGPRVSRARPGGPGHGKHGIRTNNSLGDTRLVNMCPCSAHSRTPRAALGGPCFHTTSHRERAVACGAVVVGRQGPRGKDEPEGGNWPLREDRRVSLPGHEPRPRMDQAWNKAEQDG